jgi:hypothetical protein
MKQKGRTPPAAPIDHAANLRDRLGKAAHDAGAGSPSDEWEALTESGRAYWKNIGQAVMREVVKRDPRQGEISTQGIVSSQTGKPYVQFACDLSPTQFTPGKAREIALMLLEAADAAESDAVLMAFARDQIGLDDARAAQLLDQFRKAREQARGTEASAA